MVDSSSWGSTIGQAWRTAAAQLQAAGVASPEVDARLLAAWSLGCRDTELFFHQHDAVPDSFVSAIERRLRREPVQHICGFAPFFGLELACGPGVFIPRPETELLVEWACQQLAARPVPVVVDMCSGTGAIAIAIARTLPAARVIAVERDPAAVDYLRRNCELLAPTVEIRAVDATCPREFSDLVGICDAVVTNPPYVPLGTVVDPEVHADPPQAVFGGADGLAMIRSLAAVAAELLRGNGICAIEHDDAAGSAVSAVVSEVGLRQIQVHKDLAGRDRFTTALK